MIEKTGANIEMPNGKKTGWKTGQKIKFNMPTEGTIVGYTYDSDSKGNWKLKFVVDIDGKGLWFIPVDEVATKEPKQ